MTKISSALTLLSYVDSRLKILRKKAIKPLDKKTAMTIDALYEDNLTSTQSSKHKISSKIRIIKFQQHISTTDTILLETKLTRCILLNNLRYCTQYKLNNTLLTKGPWLPGGPFCPAKPLSPYWDIIALNPLRQVNEDCMFLKTNFNNKPFHRRFQAVLGSLVVHHFP